MIFINLYHIFINLLFTHFKDSNANIAGSSERGEHGQRHFAKKGQHFLRVFCGVGCIEHVIEIILHQFREFGLVVGSVMRNDLHQAHARNARSVGQFHDDKHVVIHDQAVPVVHFMGFCVQHVTGNDCGGLRRDRAGLNQRVVGSHHGGRQFVLVVVVHVARFKLHDAPRWIARGSGTEMHDAAVNAVVLHHFFDVGNELGRRVVLQRGVFQKQVVRGLCAVKHFVLVVAQFFKLGGDAFVFQLVDDFKVPNNAKQIWY